MTWYDKDFLATGTEYVFNAATCGCGATRSLKNVGTICYACFKGNNVLKDCDTMGCGSKRAGNNAFCNPCITQSRRKTLTCFLCGADTTRGLCQQNKKKGTRQCQPMDNVKCFVLCNTYKDRVWGERCRMSRYEKDGGIFK